MIPEKTKEELKILRKAVKSLVSENFGLGSRDIISLSERIGNCEAAIAAINERLDKGDDD